MVLMKRAELIATAVLFAAVMAPLTLNAGENSMVRVRVEKGDSLIILCNRYLETPSRWREIVRINNLENPNMILPGQTLLFPAELMKGAPLSGKVTFLRGRADSMPAGGKEWKPLSAGGTVGQGDTIRTGEESRIEIRFQDGNTFLLHPNTTMGLNITRGSGDRQAKYRLSIERGTVISDIPESAVREAVVEIETPTAILGLRGTVFKSTVDDDGTTRFTVFKGSVTVEGAGETVILRQGEGTVIREGEPPLAPVKLLPPPGLKVARDTQYRQFPIRLSFEKVEGAVHYRVVLAKDRDMKYAETEKTIGAGDIFEIERIADGTYFIQAFSIDESGLQGEGSEPAGISVRSVAR